MKYLIEQRDLVNPQRFIGEGLGAPEALIRTAQTKNTDGIHGDRTIESNL